MMTPGKKTPPNEVGYIYLLYSYFWIMFALTLSSSLICIYLNTSNFI